MAVQEDQMRAAAEAAAQLIEPGMRVGLGTGRTVARLLPALAERGLAGLRCVATSPETEEVATRLGLSVEPFEALDRLDIAIDGADQVAADWWTVKGGHGAHLREKIVAAAAERFVVIVSEDKLVDVVHAPVPLELDAFGLPSTLSAIGAVSLRAGTAVTPEGGMIADYTGPIADPAAVAAWLDELPGVTGHGLFPPRMIHDVFVGGRDRPLDPPPGAGAAVGAGSPGTARLTTKLTSLSVPDAVARLRELLGAKGVKLFDVIDHSGEAEAAGLTLRDTKVAIFGAPKAGTPVMEAVPQAALDLPLKVLIWRDGDQTRLTYAPPSELAARYGLSDELAARLAAIDAITDALAAG
ncbi:MAG TPA: ribose 5-phosphate isomerase A [Solirubrobacteraceae bacterium]|nr:ribose 5-phosphate isomerase A [Solirubrobacteraceae bacterium]